MIKKIAAKSAWCATMLTFFFISAFGQNDDLVIKEIKAHRKNQEKEFRDRKKSPLTPDDRKNFNGLKYFAINLKYRLPASFVKTENTGLFMMRTTTDRLPEYRKYGDVLFTIDGVDYKLEVYQSPEISLRPGYEDYLFIPFTDQTNGHETYEVGRYLEFRIPASDSVVLDFNQCYNPYCSYNPGYSCPIPPEANRLLIPIPAGEKKYKEDH